MTPGPRLDTPFLDTPLPPSPMYFVPPGLPGGGSFALTLKKPVGTLSPMISFPFVLRVRGGHAEPL